jgi:SNF2 family DNA or RNA helicase
VRWYRIVLDEAHFIRNRGTKASKAVEMLDSVYRWCLTGTLVNNSLTDIFPHLRFLHISPQREWTSFNKMIGLVEKKRPKLAAKRVQVS